VEPFATTATAAPASLDIELVRRATRGDVAAFERLVLDRSERAYRTARAILGDDGEAADATQEAFVSAWQGLARLRDADRFDAWLRRILVNVCRERLRGRRHVRVIPLDDALNQRQPGPAFSESVADSDLLSRAFDRLDAAKRSLLVLHYLDHEPLGSIAESLGIPVGTAKWRLSEARAALARALTAEGEARR
jgi:RNA polymerase sigma-70 factor (ECF subfamily)